LTYSKAKSLLQQYLKAMWTLAQNPKGCAYILFKPHYLLKHLVYPKLKSINPEKESVATKGVERSMSIVKRIE